MDLCLYAIPGYFGSIALMFIVMYLLGNWLYKTYPERQMRRQICPACGARGTDGYVELESEFPSPVFDIRPIDNRFVHLKPSWERHIEQYQVDDPTDLRGFDWKCKKCGYEWMQIENNPPQAYKEFDSGNKREFVRLYRRKARGRWVYTRDSPYANGDNVLGDPTKRGESSIINIQGKWKLAWNSVYTPKNSGALLWLRQTGDRIKGILLFEGQMEARIQGKLTGKSCEYIFWPYQIKSYEQALRVNKCRSGKGYFRILNNDAGLRGSCYSNTGEITSFSAVRVRGITSPEDLGQRQI